MYGINETEGGGFEAGEDVDDWLAADRDGSV